MTTDPIPPFSLSVTPSTSVPPGDGLHPAEAFRRARDLLEAKSPREALKVLEPALESEPDSVALRSLRGWAYFQGAQLQRAEQEFAELVDLDPTDVWVRYALGRVIERQSRLAEALPHFRLAAAMSGDPEHETAVLRTERMLAERGDLSYDDLR